MSSMTHHGAVATYSPSISHYRLYLAGDDTIEESAVVRIMNADTVASANDSSSYGLYDPRLGSRSHMFKCITCNQSAMCQGHYGWYNIGQYVFNPIVVDDIVKWLRVVCVRCGELIVDKTKVLSFPVLKRLSGSADSISDKRKCATCLHIQPKVKQHEKSIFMFVLKYEVDEFILVPKDVKVILDRISEETNALFGRLPECHPRNYLVSKLVISPITIRPYFRNIVNQRNYKVPVIVEFMKHIIKKSKSKTDDEVKQNVYLNRCLYDMIRGGNQGGSKDINVVGGSHADAILKTYNSKKGKIRNLQLGHRTLNSSRLTISGNTSLLIDHVGIPIYISTTLQVSETVQYFNRDRLLLDILNYRCKRIRLNGTDKEKNINETNIHTIILSNGDIVYRDVKNGDFVNFNRTPSLTESSIGSHQATIFTDPEINTFQMNASVCPNYNADFDGDTMKLKVLSTIRSRVEAEYLISVNRWFLSGQYSRAMNGTLQDGVIGSSLLTKNDVVLDKLHAIRCFSACQLTIPIVFDKETYTGRELVSLLLSQTPINYSGKANFFNEAYAELIDYKDDEINVLIKNGILVKGLLDKKAIGQNSVGGIFHLIGLRYGSDIALKVVYSYQQLALAYLSFRGFSLSIDDITLQQDNRDQLDDLIAAKLVKSRVYTDKYIRGKIFPPLGVTVQQHYESQQIKILSHSDEMYVPILNSIDINTNSLFQMIMFGAKGDIPNLLKILSNVGQVSIMGGRMPESFSSYRTSAYYPRFDITPESKGFVKNSYTVGLTLEECSMAVIEAREQLVQKSQATALSGKVFRDHIKSLESCLVNYFRIVMKSKMAVQFMYGDIGIDTRYMYQHKFDMLFVNNNKLKELYPKSTSEEIKNIIMYRDKLRKALIKVDIVNNFGISNKISCSVNIPDIIDDILIQYNSTLVADYKTIATADELVVMRKLVVQYIKDMPYNFTNETIKKKQSKLPKFILNSCLVLQLLTAITLNSDTLIYMNVELLNIAFNLITLRHKNVMVLPGAVCGIMAAQSLVEPLTQGMLDSLHGGSSGAKALLNKVKDATTSKELSIYAKELTISFIKPYCYDKTFVEDIKEKIISVTLNKLITEWQVFLETFANPVHPRYKHEGEHIKKYAHSYAGSLPNNISKWCIRLSLDKHMMALKYVSLEDISLHLLEKFTDIFIVPCSSADTYLRIYIMESEFAKVSDIEKYVVDTFLQSIIATYVKGIPSILDASVKQAAKYTLDENTGEFIKTDEYVIKTVGSNHADLLNNDSLIQYIDVNQLLTNDVSETIDIFGIEAARTKTIDQIMDSIGKPISYAHVTIYADTVTWTGELVPLEKTIAREKNKTLLKASWNFASKNLTNGAKIGTYEEATNITTSVLMGNVPKVGTHYSNILMDEEIIMKNTSRIIDVINSL